MNRLLASSVSSIHAGGAVKQAHINEIISLNYTQKLSVTEGIDHSDAMLFNHSVNFVLVPADVGALSCWTDYPL
jgi:hypothetical protein